VLELADLRKVGGIDKEQTDRRATHDGGEHEQSEDDATHVPLSRHLEGGQFCDKTVHPYGLESESCPKSTMYQVPGGKPQKRKRALGARFLASCATMPSAVSAP